VKYKYFNTVFCVWHDINQTLSASQNGELRVGLTTDKVAVTTYFKGLQNHNFQDAPVAREYDTTPTLYEARVDVKKFSQFLQGHFNPTKVICSKYNNRGDPLPQGLGLCFCVSLYQMAADKEEN